MERVIDGQSLSPEVTIMNGYFIAISTIPDLYNGEIKYCDLRLEPNLFILNVSLRIRRRRSRKSYSNRRG